MLQKSLPKRMLKVRDEKPYVCCFEVLTESLDGNSILLLFDNIETIFNSNSIDDKEMVVNTFIRLVNEFGYTLHKIDKYVRKCLEQDDWKSLFSARKRYEDILFLLLRYNTGAQKAGLANSIIAFPQNIEESIKKINDFVIQQHNQEEEFKKAAEKLAKYNFSDVFEGEIYYSVVPQNEKELIAEGYMMHNCLVIRGKDFSSGHMQIVFIQKEKGHSYIDVVMDSDNKIIWAVKDYHANVKDKDLELVYHWYTNNVMKVDSYKEMFR